MDPFTHFLSTEGCSSSESGWTTYLASPMQDDSAFTEDYHNTKDDVDDGEGNSDDSMVSDAFSAPSHHRCKHEGGQGSRSNAHLKHDKGDDSSKHSSRKKAKKEMKKRAENSSKSKERLGCQPKYLK